MNGCSPEYQEGRKAKNAGLRISSCPYDPFEKSQRRQHDDWNDGWMDRDYEIFDQENRWRDRMDLLDAISYKYYGIY